MKLRSIMWLGVISMAFAVAGCESDDGEGGEGGAGGGGGGGGGKTSVCDSVADGFTACGGDIEGSWEILDICDGGVDLGQDECPGAESSGSVELKDGGLLTFSEGRATMSSISLQIEGTTKTPLSCLEPFDCSGYQFLLSMVGFQADCSEVDEACACSFEGEMASEPLDGTYTVEGNRLTIVEGTSGEEEEGDEVSVYEYCVKGDLLYMVDVTDEEVGVSSVLVARRK